MASHLHRRGIRVISQWINHLKLLFFLYVRAFVLSPHRIKESLTKIRQTYNFFERRF